MKRSELVTSVALVPLDYAALLFAAWSALQIRRLDIVTEIRPVLFDIGTGDYLRRVAVVAVLWIVIFAFAGLYRVRATDRLLSTFGRILYACSMGFLSITVLVFLRGELFNSRFIILAALVLAIVTVTFVRVVAKYALRWLQRRGYAAHRVAVVGGGDQVRAVTTAMRARPELGYQLAGAHEPTESGLSSLREQLRQDALDEVLFVDAGTTPQDRQRCLELVEEFHVPFRYAPDLLLSPVAGPHIDFELGMAIVDLPETTLRGWGRVMKRCIDIVGSVVGLIVLSPVAVLVAVAIILDSGLPIFYVSDRIGRSRAFPMIKFRSMQTALSTGAAYGGESAEQLYQELIRERSERKGPVPKIIDDPRWTRVGKWIRRFSLDELPQLMNVLRGEMSLVGPRPHLPSEVANYERHHQKVLAIKPGMTGLAQVSGRSDIDFDEEVRLDRYYIEHWSLWLDIRILLKTVAVVFQSRKTL